MKKLSFYLMAGLILMSSAFTSCEKVAEELENAVELTINTSLDAPIVAVPEEESKAGEARFNETYVLDLSGNADLADYLDKIQSIEITEIMVTIQNAIPENLTLINGTYSITDNENGDSFEFYSPNNLPLNSGDSFTVTDEMEGWDTLNEIISSKHASTLRAVGSINNETFEVTFMCSLKVKAVVKK